MTTSRHIAPIDAFHAVGLSATVLTTVFSPIIFSGWTRFHSSEPLTSIALASIFDILLVALFIFVALAALRATRAWPAWRLLLVIVLPAAILFLNATLLHATLFEGSRYHKAFLLLGWAIFVLLLRFRSDAWYRNMLQAGRVILTGCGIFGFLALAELAWAATWRPPPKEIALSPGTRQLTVSSRHPLLVWIIFDELSYDQLFDHRASDLALPNFDALRSESTLYTQVQPVAFYTAQVLPSLLLGTPVTAVDSTRSNRVRLRTPDHPGWQFFDPKQTLFAEARRNGWHSAIVGWYMPYCSMFQGWVDRCYSEGWGLTLAPMSTFSGTRTNMAISLKVFGEKLIAPRKSSQDNVSFVVQERLLAFERLEPRAFAALESPTEDFIFLHLPLPHPPAIYDRHSGRFSRVAGYSYLDNLALTDAVLGKIMTVLHSSPRWPETTLIVNGDHSWRIPIWKPIDGWTPEDERASRGVFDTRPALFIHVPGQSAPQTITAPVPLLDLHTMISSVLRAPASNGSTAALVARKQ